MASSISMAITPWKARKANAARERFLTRPRRLCPLISVSIYVLSLIYRQAFIHLLDRLIAAFGLDLGRGGLAFTPVAPDHDSPRAQVRKTFCGSLTYPAGSAGDEYDLPIHNPLRAVHVPPPCSSGCFAAPQWHQVASSCPARR